MVTTLAASLGGAYQTFKTGDCNNPDHELKFDFGDCKKIHYHYTQAVFVDGTVLLYITSGNNTHFPNTLAPGCTQADEWRYYFHNDQGLVHLQNGCNLCF